MDLREAQDLQAAEDLTAISVTGTVPGPAFLDPWFS